MLSPFNSKTGMENSFHASQLPNVPYALPVSFLNTLMPNVTTITAPTTPNAIGNTLPIAVLQLVATVVNASVNAV